MTTAWRRVRARYRATAFDGFGAARDGGRWNSPGLRVAYASDSPALAILEMIINNFHLPESRLIRAEIPEKLVEAIDPTELPTDWRNSPNSEASKFGDEWILSRRSAVLLPSSMSWSGTLAS